MQRQSSTMANEAPPSYHEIHGTSGTSTTQPSTGVVSQGQSGPLSTSQQGSSATRQGPSTVPVATPQRTGMIPVATPQGPGMIPVATPQGPGIVPMATPQGPGMIPVGPGMIPVATPQGPRMMTMPGQPMTYVSSKLFPDYNYRMTIKRSPLGQSEIRKYFYTDPYLKH